MNSEQHRTVLQLIAIGGELNRALSDIMAWAELQAMDGCDPRIPVGLTNSAEKALADWRKTLKV